MSDTAPTPPPGPWEAKPVRDVVRVAGADARSFLQGQLSQDLGGLAPGEALWTFLLQPTGKVDAWLRIEATGPEATGGDSFALDVDEGWGEAVRDRLDRFRIRVKAEISFEPGGRVIPTPEGPDAYEEVRITSGIPAMGAELTERTIPAEVGQWVVDASVSFTKGCYTGQELVARIDSRGAQAPRKLRTVVVEEVAGARAPRPGDRVLVSGDEVGVVTSVAPSGSIGLAYLRRAVEPEIQALLVGSGGAELAARICQAPLR